MLIRLNDPEDHASGQASLGTAKEFAGALAPFNTAEDGSPPDGVTVRMYGPGMTVEYATSSREIMQAMVSCYDEETAFPVLWRMCRQNGWKLQDIETGQIFG